MNLEPAAKGTFRTSSPSKLLIGIEFHWRFQAPANCALHLSDLLRTPCEVQLAAGPISCSTAPMREDLTAPPSVF